MSIEKFLNLIRERFTASEGQLLLNSLQQDPLVWQFVKNENRSWPYFESAPNEISSFSPGKIVTWMIQEEMGIPINILETPDFHLPDQLQQQAAQTFESTVNTGLPPADLLSAGFLALNLLERRIRNGNWQGISDEIIVKRNAQTLQKIYKIWRTPIACLFEFCPDFNELIADFIKTEPSPVGMASIPIFIHAFLANPLEQTDLLERLFAFAQNLSIDLQLESLKWLEAFHQSKLCERLAKNLIQTRKNIEIFAKTYSELESIESTNRQDPLDKPIRYALPEDINRLAAFYFYSGNKEKATETYERSRDLLDFLAAQTTYQALATNKNKISPAQWMHILKSMPNSKQARLSFVRSLIDAENLDEALKQLEDLPNSSEKHLLQSMVLASSDPDKAFSSKSLDLSEVQSWKGSPQQSGFYVHQGNCDLSNDLLLELAKYAGPAQDYSWIEKLIEVNFKEPQTIKLARDIFEKVENLDKAIELTSYLERFEPENKSHKQSLAQLLGSADRWEDAFSISQDLIKSDPSPETRDLEGLAEAALRTNRIDMAISICQNILKQASKNVKALILLGEAYMLKGDSVKSIQHMEQVVEMIPDEPDSWLTLANLWERSGQSDRAFDIYNKGILVLPNDPKLLRSLGKAHIEKQAPADALMHLKKAHEIDPENRDGVKHLAQAHYQLGQYEQAFQLLEPLMAYFEKDAVLAKLLGKVLLAMNEKVFAEPILTSAAEQKPEDVEVVLLAADLILTRLETVPEEVPQNDLGKLESILQKSLLTNQSHPRIRLHLADIDRIRGDYVKALEVYRKLSEESQLEKTLPHWRLPYGLGQTALRLGNHEVSVAALQDAASKQPENLLILHGLAEAYQITDLPRKAHETAISALRLAPDEMDNILWYANFKTKNNEPTEAIRALKEALQINSERVELKLWLCRILISIDSDQEAREILADLINNAQAKPQELHQAAYLCVHLNELDLAVRALEKSRQLSQGIDPILIMDLAVLYSLVDQRKNALNVLNIEEDFIIQHPQIAFVKSDILSSLGQYALAFECLKTIEEYTNDSTKSGFFESDQQNQSPLFYSHDFTQSGYFYRMGQLSRALGDIRRAEQYLSQALNIKPEDMHIRKSLKEAYQVGLDFAHALEIGKMNHKTTSDLEGYGQYHIDFLCSNAEIYLLKGNYEPLGAMYEEISEVHANNPRCLAVLSQIEAHLGKFESAEAHLVRAIKSYQDHFSSQNSYPLEDTFREILILNNIGEAALSLGNYHSALEYQQLAWQKLGNQPLIQWRNALTLIKCAEHQQIAEALSLVNHAPGEDALSEEKRVTAQSLIEELGDYLSDEKAMCLKARCTSAFTGNWPLSHPWKACLMSPEEAAAIILGSDDDANVEEILAVYPEQPQVLKAFGIYALRNKKKDGIAFVETALHIDTSDPISHALLAMLQKDDPLSAINSFKTALSFWPNEPEWHAMLADLLSKTGDSDTAEHHIAQAIHFQPENATFWQRSAEIKLVKNDFYHAKQDLEKSASYQSKNPVIWIKMADVNRKIGNVSEAIQNIQRASNLAPDNIDIALQEAKFLAEQKRYIEAEEKALNIVNKDQNNIQALILLSKAQVSQGKLDQALELLSQAQARNPKNPQIALESLKIRKDREGIEAVLPELIKLAHDNPENPEVLTRLTDWLIQANRLKEAIETAQTVLRIIPQQAEVYLMLGRLQRKNGQLDQAIAHLSDAIKFDPNLVEAYLELGKTYQERRNLEEAIKIFQKGAQVNASDPRPYFYAGMALKECKDYSNAEMMFKQAKKYSPDDPNIIRQLGVVTALNLINNLREVN